jgi:molybdate transport system substrate-binding protein
VNLTDVVEATHGFLGNRDRHGVRLPRRGLLALPAAALGALTLAACGGETSTSTGPSPAGAPPTSAATPEPKELVMLVASSLTDAFNEMALDFPKQPGNEGIRFTPSFGASSQLRTQLEQGAPVDLFASADTVQMDVAVKAGMIVGTPRVFVRNRLTVIVPRDNRAGITKLADLARPGLKFVTTSPDVPVGNYTRQALQKMAAGTLGAGFDQKVLANVVSEEANVRQVVTKVQLGEADAGVCYVSDVTPASAPALTMIDIPDQFNTIAEYPVAVTKLAKAPATAQRFITYLGSAAGQAILKKNNFIPAI